MANGPYKKVFYTTNHQRGKSKPKWDIIFLPIKPVNPKGNQFWIFIGSTDAEAEAPILGPPYSKNWLIGKDSDAGKDWRQDEMGMTGWNGWMALLSQWTWVWQAPGDGDGQGSLECCSPWVCKESDMTDGLNSNKTLSQ